MQVRQYASLKKTPQKVLTKKSIDIKCNNKPVVKYMDSGFATAGKGQSIVVSEQDMKDAARSFANKGDEVIDLGIRDTKSKNIPSMTASFATAGSKKVIKVDAEDILNASRILSNIDQVSYITVIF